MTNDAATTTSNQWVYMFGSQYSVFMQMLQIIFGDLSLEACIASCYDLSYCFWALYSLLLYNPLRAYCHKVLWQYALKFIGPIDRFLMILVPLWSFVKSNTLLHDILSWQVSINMDIHDLSINWNVLVTSWSFIQCYRLVDISTYSKKHQNLMHTLPRNWAHLFSLKDFSDPQGLISCPTYMFSLTPDKASMLSAPTHTYSIDVRYCEHCTFCGLSCTCCNLKRLCMSVLILKNVFNK